MSLKGDRATVLEDISYFMNTVATRGGVVSLVTVGSGAALDQAQAVVGYSANQSGVQPIGILTCDVVNYDLTRQHINFYRDEVQLGGKVSIISKGWVTTNNITGNPGAGDYAVLSNSGNIGTVTVANFPTNNNVGLPKVGRWLSTKDEDGYAKLQIDL